MNGATRPDMNDYIALVDEASARVRRVIYVMVVASALIAAAAWNYRTSSWDNLRLAVVDFAAAHLGEEPERTTADSEQAYLLPYAKAYVKALHKEWKPDAATKAALLDRQKTMQHGFDDTYGHIKVPILGIGFNANDIGLVGGFGLMVVVFVLVLSMMRERANIRHAFAKAILERCVPDVYRVVSMSQVLTVPPGLIASQRVQPWLNRIHKALFALPAAVQILVVYVDIQTFHYGWAISRFNTLVELIGGGAFLLGILILTVWCFVESAKKDRIWDIVARAIEKKGAAPTCEGELPRRDLEFESGDLPGVATVGEWI
jgi:hypothetical protein